MSEHDEASNENGGVTRRTRSGRATKSPAVVAAPKSTRSKKISKPIFEEDEEIPDASTLDNFFAQEESDDFDMPNSDGADQPLRSDSPDANFSRALGEESNGSMDGMLKTCFEDNIIQTEGRDQSIPIEPMDVSIADSTEDSENLPLEFDNINQDAEADSGDDSNHKEVSSDDVEETTENEVEDRAKMTVVDDADALSDGSENFEEISNMEKEPRKESSGDDISNDSLKEEEEMAHQDETEVVSEDELPVVEKPEVKDAENVSDDELPGPKPADLPADTEVVSEDELPSSKKESSNRKRKADGDAESGYDPGSPTSEGESTAKKPAVEGDAKTPSAEEKPAKKTALPELDIYWKAVNDNTADFTGWTYLLQYVDQENDVEAAREAYDAFLSHYPYCYGYWRKYGDYEKRKGSKKKCLEVLERGLRGIPLSVDLWIHFLNHIKATRTEDTDYIREQYDRAIAACGLEFRSDRLWESYIKWESEHGIPLNVTMLYDKLLSTPTLGYTSHFDNFQEHIMGSPVASCVSREEFVRLRGEVRTEMKNDPPLDSDPDIPPGEEEADDHVRSDEEAAAIRERIVSIRRKVHKITIDQVAQRWDFEGGIKRPYFHVKPLERCQLKNWKAYLEWEEQQQDRARTLVLYERCLIACALYEEFWLRLVQYLERCTAAETEEAEKAALVARSRDVLERACGIHHLERPGLHTHWALFEERQGNSARAADILERLDKACPGLLQVACRRINLERRRGDLDKCVQLYEQYISQSKSKGCASALALKYARFLLRARRDSAGALRVLRVQAARDPTAQRLYLQMVDVALTVGEDHSLQQAVGYLDEYLAVEGIDGESKLLFLQRKAELLEEWGDSAEEIQTALSTYRAYHKQQHKKRNKDKNASGDPNATGKKKDATAAPPLPPSAGAGTGTGVAASYYGQGQQAPQQAQQQQYEAGYPQQPPYHQWSPAYHHATQYHHNPWNPYPNYY